MTSAFPSWQLGMFAAAAAVSATGVGLAVALARRNGVLAQPGERQSHQVPTPSGAGIGMVAALVATGIVAAQGLPPWWTRGVLPGLCLLALVGWWDDHRPLGVLPRLAVQVAVSLWLIACLPVGPETAVSWLVTGTMAVALLAMMNAWNFMDGSNGMAGGQGLFSGLLLAGVFAAAGTVGLSLAALSLAGACAGFLPWNLPRARAFMGDAGSVPLGFTVAALLFGGWLAGALHPAVALLVPAVFMVDAGLTLALRILRGERWYTPHRKHVYQRLLIAGWSHDRTFALYQAINLFVVLPGVIVATMRPELAWWVTGASYLSMVTAWMMASLKVGETT